MAMLRIFKAASLQTSILDDFLVYEERQRILFEEKSRISGRRQQHNPQFFPPPFLPSGKPDSLATTITTTSSSSESAEKEAILASPEAAAAAAAEPQPAESDENGGDSKPPTKPTNLVILGHSKEQFDDGSDSIMRIGSLLIDSDAGGDPPSASQNDVITVGSMHIKVGKPAPPL